MTAPFDVIVIGGGITGSALAWGAARIMTPNDLPVYDEEPRYPGAYVVTCHSGVTLASVHALCLEESLARETRHCAPAESHV